MVSSPTTTVKLVLLGESAVGKSSIVTTYVNQQFKEHTEATIGAAFLTQTIVLDDRTIKFEIWDTAGQERYHSLAPMYYRGAQAAIVVYDITNTNSFARAQAWVTELKKQLNTDSEVVIALTANKHDRESERKITTEEGKNYADEQDLLFIETSAKQNYNINELFKRIAKEIPSNDAGPHRNQNGVSLGSANNSSERGLLSGCCK